MLLPRIIARLDIKGPNVVKGIRMEGLRVMGKPMDLAKKYAEQGAHEILYIDTVASLYGRNQLGKLIEETSREIFIPITVGGGIGSVEDTRQLLNCGADKIAVNTYAIRRPGLLESISTQLGGQAVCLSIQAKRSQEGWGCYLECGREPSGRDVPDWAAQGCNQGGGEILLTSVDRDGTLSGPDLDLIRAVQVPVPLVYCGGIRNVQDVMDCLEAGADGVAIGAALHYNRLTIGEINGRINQIEFPPEKASAA